MACSLTGFGWCFTRWLDVWLAGGLIAGGWQVDYLGGPDDLSIWLVIWLTIYVAIWLAGKLSG